MEKKFIIAGNWKMNMTVSDSLNFFKEIEEKLSKIDNKSGLDKVEIIIFPPAVSLYSLASLNSSIKLGAQNMYFEEKGAFTGEISAEMVKESAEYILAGHSERRWIFKESDEEIFRKLKRALDTGLTPILCVGETLEDRESQKTFDRIGKQLSEGLRGIEQKMLDNIYIAYEPVWAIGTGKTATPEIAEEVQSFIARQMTSITGSIYRKPILYGGSVKPSNCKDLLEMENINGLLIGGSSLKTDTFFDIIATSLELI